MGWSKSRRLMRFPQWITIDCHNYCDASCGYCVYAELAADNEYPQSFMDFGLFERLVAEMVEHADEIDSTRFGNIAEHFMTPKHWFYTEHFLASGLTMYITSNMTHIDAATMDRLDELGWDHGELVAHVQPGMGVDYENQLLNLKEAQRRWGDRVQHCVIDPPRGWADYDASIPFRKATRCDAGRPDHTMIIGFDGRVQLCCQDVRQSVIVGDLNNETISEVWNCEKVADARRALSNGEMKLCNNCEWGAT